MWEINGLPLHPLIVHAAVVFTPLAALSGLGYALLPTYRDRLRWVTLVLVVIGFGAIWAAYLSGDNFLESDHFQTLGGDAQGEDRAPRGAGRRAPLDGDRLRVVTVLAVWQHARQGAARYALSGLVVVGAVLDAHLDRDDRRRRLPGGLGLT